MRPEIDAGTASLFNPGLEAAGDVVIVPMAAELPENLDQRFLPLRAQIHLQVAAEFARRRTPPPNADPQLVDVLFTVAACGDLAGIAQHLLKAAIEHLHGDFADAGIAGEIGRAGGDGRSEDAATGQPHPLFRLAHRAQPQTVPVAPRARHFNGGSGLALLQFELDFTQVARAPARCDPALVECDLHT